MVDNPFLPGDRVYLVAFPAIIGTVVGAAGNPLLIDSVSVHWDDDPGGRNCEHAAHEVEYWTRAKA